MPKYTITVDKPNCTLTSVGMHSLLTNLLDLPAEFITVEVRERTVYGRAADVLRRLGWIQGDYVRSGEGCCILGALRTAVVGQPWLEGATYNTELDPVSLIAQACSKALGVPNIAHWNDAPGRTKEEVLAFLERMDAEELERQEREEVVPNGLATA